MSTNGKAAGDDKGVKKKWSPIKNAIEKLFPSTSTTCSDMNCNYARRLLGCATGVQFLGVTGCVFGLWALDTWTISVSWPVIVAYSMIIVVVMISMIRDRPISVTGALRCIYFLFITVDTFMLGILVSLTGGTAKSVFIPLFVLIPTVTPCFCRSDRPQFWVNIALILGIFGFLAVSPNLSNLLKQFDGWGQALASLLPPYNSLELKSPMYADVLTIFCLWAAAACHAGTSRIRKEACMLNGRTNICHELFHPSGKT